MATKEGEQNAHPMGEPKRAVEAELQRRLPAAIDGAFLRQAYADLRHYADRARGSLGLKAQVKCAIARLPRPLADLCATALGRRGEAREGQTEPLEGDRVHRVQDLLSQIVKHATLGLGRAALPLGGWQATQRAG